jgi:hypothetical protein
MPVFRCSALKAFRFPTVEPLPVRCDDSDFPFYRFNRNEFNWIPRFLIHHLEAIIITLLFGCPHISFLGKSFLDLFSLPIISILPSPRWLGKPARSYFFGIIREATIIVIGGLRQSYILISNYFFTCFHKSRYSLS